MYKRDSLDTDSDDEGSDDTNEAGLTLSGNVGANGLDNSYDGGADDYADVNGSFDNTQTDNFPDADADVSSGGDVDWRDAIDDTDTDGDGVPDYTDLDDDNDGVLDTVEDNCSVFTSLGATTGHGITLTGGGNLLSSGGSMLYANNNDGLYTAVISKTMTDLEVSHL